MITFNCLDREKNSKFDKTFYDLKKARIFYNRCLRSKKIVILQIEANNLSNEDYMFVTGGR